MLQAMHNARTLVRAARRLARYDALFPLEEMPEPPVAIRVARSLSKMRLPWEAREEPTEGARQERPGQRLAAALQSLGPAYIKLGQLLATRPDIIGNEIADDLSELQDRLPPFSQADARDIIERELNGAIDEFFTEFGPPVAAASIAQVHYATTRPADEEGAQSVAVKVLRPGIEAAFARDLASFQWLARLIERTQPGMRRLRPVEVVKTLADTVEIEMDLRLEAAAASELAEQTADDDEIHVPVVDWKRTSRRVLTLERVEGIPIWDTEALQAAGHDLSRLARVVIQTFLHQAMQHGFFHADMHPGNLFVDADGVLVVVDFGIMGRLSERERRFLAEILYGFYTRDYRRVAEIHFDAGYVPRHKSVDAFAQALRSIAEPIFGRKAREISMGRLLAQLFQTTETFEMQTQPQLLLLQKNMVIVEGVARDLDPEADIWEIAEPVIESWVSDNLGPEARLLDAAEGAAALARSLPQLPHLIDRAERAVEALADAGVRIRPESAEEIAREQTRLSRANWAWLAVLGAILFVLGAWLV